MERHSNNNREEILKYVECFAFIFNILNGNWFKVHFRGNRNRDGSKYFTFLSSCLKKD